MMVKTLTYGRIFAYVIIFIFSSWAYDWPYNLPQKPWSYIRTMNSNADSLLALLKEIPAIKDSEIAG